MIICPNLYNGTQQSNVATGSNMNCGLQQQYDEATRHSVFSGLSIESHWLSHRQQMHAIVKQEPRDEGEYGHYCAEDKATSFQTPLTPPGLPAVNNYSFPTPPQPEYSSGGSPGEHAGDFHPVGSQQHQVGGHLQLGRPPSSHSAAGVSPPPQPGPGKASPPAQLTPPSPGHQAGSKAPTPDLQKQDMQDNSQSSNSENEYYENGDSLRRLQMALQRTGMIASEEKLQCPMCNFFCSIRSQFNEHLQSHETKCTACDFNAETGEKLREHMRVAHENLYEEEMWTEEDTGLNTPKVNSQGKVKIFRCKQCEFSAVTKLEFWEHSRSHIKQERLLTCPKCPFVTEYKHHLEYHLRNHFGSKPFKCDKCSYSCVNKSMLNSHLKSHSNVYQFRCSDCTYATKYCHSLKLHLRKYGHNPAMVLNPDGSPNPLPIVDVYGTRRGPKQKAKTPPSQQEKQPVPSAHQGNHPQSQQLPVPVFNPYSLLPAQMPYYNLLNGFAPFAFRHDVKLEEKNNNVEKTPMEEEPFEDEAAESAPGSEEKTPLDLTCPEVESGAETPVSKNRRKGKAFKLERIALTLQRNSEEEAQKCQTKVAEPDTERPKVDTRKDESQDQYNCSYCDISFKDIVMYTMHMGYHGYQDPFTCNMCGQQTSDKVAFFLHIARTSHS